MMKHAYAIGNREQQLQQLVAAENPAPEEE